MRESVEIKLETNGTEFRPGDELQLKVHLGAGVPGSVKKIRCSLGWVVEGSDRRNEFCHASELLPLTTKEGLAEKNVTVTMKLPQGPLSYDGKLFSLRWLVQVEAGKLMAEAPLVLRAAED